MSKLMTALGAGLLAGATLAAVPAAADPGHGRHYSHSRYSGYNTYYRNYEDGYQHATIGGVVLGIRNGYIADLQTGDGQVIPVNERTLLRYGTPLYPGHRYAIYGYYGNGAFVADSLQGY